MSIGYDDDDSSSSQDQANVAAAQESVINALSSPQTVSGDAGSVTSQPIAALIQAANYLAGIAATKTRRLGIRYTRLSPGGTVRVRYRDPRWRDGPEW